MTRTSAIHHDFLATIRALPQDLLQDIPQLLVNRLGRDAQAYMQTENIIGYTAPQKTYKLTDLGLSICDDASTPDLQTKKIPPERTQVSGVWQTQIDLTREQSNILGGNGSYILPKGQQTLDIPVVQATREYLAYYNCELIKSGETLRFHADCNLPITVTNIGKNYQEGYLYDNKKGGGAYIEVHDRPHFHMPLQKNTAGYLIIGKRDQTDSNTLELTAFGIPYGYAVYMRPWVVHSDAHLVGRYLVVYSVTKNFSTVIVRKNNKQLAKIGFLTNQ